MKRGEIERERERARDSKREQEGGKQGGTEEGRQGERGGGERACELVHAKNEETDRRGEKGRRNTRKK